MREMRFSTGSYPRTGGDNQKEFPETSDEPNFTEATSSFRSCDGPPSGRSHREHGHASDANHSTRRSSDTELVYTREGVCVWPSRKRCIAGKLSLVKQNATPFFTWLPSSHGTATSEASSGSDSANEITDVPFTPVAQGQYAVHPIPLSDIKSIQKHTPPLGNHHIVLVLRNGLTHPPYYFTTGGVRALFKVIRQLASVTKCPHESNLFLINDLEDPLQKSLAAMDLADELMLQPAQLAQLPHCQGKDGEPEGIIGRVLGGCHRATQFARDSTSSMLSTPRPTSVLPSNGSEPLAAQDKEQTNVGMFELLDRSESESMANGWSPCAPPLTEDEWYTYQNSAGKVVDAKTLRQRIFDAGVEKKIRKEAWKFLLGMYRDDGTKAWRHRNIECRRKEYECIKAQWTSISDKQAAKFAKWRERKSRIDKDVNRTDSSHEFFKGSNHKANVETLRSILLTYSMYNFDLGYCQGMADLASPILYVMEDEALAFWCFAHLMERMEPNFSTDCVGMHSQLEALKSLIRLCDPELHHHFENKDCLNYFFCYRWLLVNFKREFTFEEAIELQEAILACPLTPNFQIYMCAAVLRMHRQEILTQKMSFDELLSFCICLAGKLDLGRTMRVAEQLIKTTGEAGKQCLKPLNMLSPAT